MNYSELLKNHLDNNGRLILYPSKRKYKLFALIYLASKFETGVIYKEKEVNAILDENHTFHDSCLLRRELFTNGFLNRKRDGSAYWLEEQQPKLEEFGIVL